MGLDAGCFRLRHAAMARQGMLVTGYWMLDTGCWILDAGYSMLDARYWMLDAGCLSLVTAQLSFKNG